MSTPVTGVGICIPEYRADIKEVSGKWAKRTKKLAIRWPKEGTFDLRICEEMIGEIKNYKIKDKSEKRVEKRKLEMHILELFKKERRGEIRRRPDNRLKVFPEGERKRNEVKQVSRSRVSYCCERLIEKMYLLRLGVELREAVKTKVGAR